MRPPMIAEPRPAIVLVHPEIPGNTGAVGRTCVALDMELVLIHPLGFEISDKRVKRSGLDYWPHIRLAEFPDWDAFLAERAPRDDQLFLFEEYAPRTFYEPDYPVDAYLVLGRETNGLPQEIVDAHAAQMVSLPMRSDKVRSLNLANTVAAAAYQAVRGHI